VAKKKSRVPPPPRPAGSPSQRRVQAPKARKEPRQHRDWGRSKWWLIGSGGVVGVVVLIVVLATVLGSSGDASALTDAGCTQQTFPSQGRKHVAELEPGFEYNSFPPTSGPHNPSPAIWNIYDEPIEEFILVHNLEHGGIVVQYGDQVPAATVAQIRDWYANSDRNGILVAPYPELKDKVALTAWTQLATCPGFNEKAFDSFVDLHRYKGPERFPAEALQPGM
jgi:hypothetical protein